MNKKIFFWLVQRVVARPLRPLARMAPVISQIDYKDNKDRNFTQSNKCV